MAPHVNDKLDLFDELIEQNIPDVELGQTLFAYFGARWDVQVVKTMVLDLSEPIPTDIVGYSITFAIDEEIVSEYEVKYKDRALDLCVELVEKYISEKEDIDVAERYLTASE